MSQIWGPLGIVVGTNRIYIADGQNKRIDIYDKNGNLAAAPISTGTFSLPQGLVLDGLNHLFVADYAVSMVFKIDLSSNSVVTTFNGMGGSMPSSMDGPIGIWCNNQGTTVVVVENLNGKRVRIFQQQGGGNYIPIQTLPVPSGAVSFTPVGVMADPSGNLYVSDDSFWPTADLCVWKYAPPYSSAVTVADNSAGHLWDPRFLTMDSAGDFYVGNRGTIGPSSMSVFDKNWNFLYQCLGGAGSNFVNAQGVGVDEVGHAYITDEGNNRVVRYASCPFVTLPTPTNTASNTPTPSPTVTPTKTPTNTPTMTSTNSLTVTPTSTFTPTPTPSFTGTPTAVGCGAPIESYCYPNPAGGTTATILCNLCEPGQVNINIYNVAANLVETYSFQGNMGVNRFSINVGGLSHGIYYYVVKAQGSTGTHQSKTCKFAVIR